VLGLSGVSVRFSVDLEFHFFPSRFPAIKKAGERITDLSDCFKSIFAPGRVTRQTHMTSIPPSAAA
jgi:hypothetical protein